MIAGSVQLNAGANNGKADITFAKAKIAIDDVVLESFLFNEIVAHATDDGSHLGVSVPDVCVVLDDFCNNANAFNGLDR